MNLDEPVDEGGSVLSLHILLDATEVSDLDLLLRTVLLVEQVLQNRHLVLFTHHATLLEVGIFPLYQL